MTKQRGYHLIDAAAFAEKVSHGTLQIPSRERHPHSIIR
jgi:hypothetical protein